MVRSATDPLDEEAGEQRVPGLRLSRRGIVVLAGLGAVVLGLVCWLVFFSSFLQVRSVAVQGLSSGGLTANQVRSALAGVEHRPLARIDLDGARRRVVAIPRVAKAELWRGWPHTLRVKVTERRPVAVLRTDDGRYTQVDADGVSFATGDTPPAGVPVVELQLSGPATDALGVIGRPRLIQAAVTVAAALPARVSGQAGAVQVHSYDDIRLQLAGGVTVRWGSQERSARKAVVLAALLGRSGRNYDVSAPDAPAVSG